MGYPDDSGNLQMSALQNRVKWTQSQTGGPDQWQVAEGDVLGISMMDNDPSETHGEGAGEKSRQPIHCYFDILKKHTTSDRPLKLG